MLLPKKYRPTCDNEGYFVKYNFIFSEKNIYGTNNNEYFRK